MSQFESLTVILLVSNETETLKSTVEGVLHNCEDEDVKNIVLFLKSDSCPGAETARQIIEEEISDKIEVRYQTAFTNEGFFQELPLLATGSHFVIMASDGEMDPRTLKDFISIAKEKPDSIVCGAKWHKDSVVENHSRIRAFGSNFLNKFAAFVFGVDATDLFSIFQIYPVDLYKKLESKENRLLYEYTLKPLRLGVEYIEIPTVYRKKHGRRGAVAFYELVKLAVKYCLNTLWIRFIPEKYL